MEQPKLVITTPNIAFIVMRLNLLLGQFNYGKRGILDFTHHRLFTFRTLKLLLKNQGYRLERVSGIPLPFELLFGNTAVARALTAINTRMIRVSKSLFSYQIHIEATPLPTAQHLLSASETTAGERVASTDPTYAQRATA
jgi:hypothetical protein